MMNNKKNWSTLIGSFLIFIVGLSRILFQSIAPTPLFVAYVLMITGLIGLIANSIVIFGKSKHRTE